MIRPIGPVGHTAAKTHIKKLQKILNEAHQQAPIDHRDTRYDAVQAYMRRSTQIHVRTERETTSRNLTNKF